MNTTPVCCYTQTLFSHLSTAYFLPRWCRQLFAVKCCYVATEPCNGSTCNRTHLHTDLCLITAVLLQNAPQKQSCWYKNMNDINRCDESTRWHFKTQHFASRVQFSVTFWFLLRNWFHCSCELLFPSYRERTPLL